MNQSSIGNSGVISGHIDVEPDNRGASSASAAVGKLDAPTVLACDQSFVVADARTLRRMTCGGWPKARRKARRIRSRSAKPVSRATTSI